MFLFRVFWPVFFWGGLMKNVENASFWCVFTFIFYLWLTHWPLGLFLHQEGVWWALRCSRVFSRLPRPIDAFKQDGWFESLPLREREPASTRGRKSQEARAPDQSAAVSGEGGDESALETSVFMAVSRARRCCNAVSSSKCFSCQSVFDWCSTLWKNSNSLNFSYIFFFFLQAQTLF